MEDFHLYEKMKAGDQTAFDQLFRKHYAELVKHAYYKTYDQAISEDIVQNIFIELWTKRNKWQIEISLIAYLKKTVNSRCIDYFRKLKVLEDHQKIFKQEFLNLDINSPEEVLLRKESLIAIYDKIEDLPPKCKIVFKLSRFEEMSYKEIAEHLEISQKTVEFHISTALRLLRQMIFTILLIGV